jgi:hypothetical protein
VAAVQKALLGVSGWESVWTMKPENERVRERERERERERQGKQNKHNK